MTHPDGEMAAGNTDDDLLTAYLDGELAAAVRARLEARMLAEPALKARLDALARGGRPFGAAYGALLSAAPDARLKGQFAALMAAQRARSARRGWRAWTARVAAAAVVFIAGAAIGYLALPRLMLPASPGWRQVVAEYQGLMTSDTLKAIPDNSAVVASELAAAGGKLALDLDPGKLALPNAEIKRAEILEFHGKPLVQVAYLADDQPVALCIIANGQPDKSADFETREGFNIVFWTDGGRGYMLIGKLPRQTLEGFAGDLQPRV